MRKFFSEVEARILEDLVTEKNEIKQSALKVDEELMFLSKKNKHFTIEITLRLWKGLHVDSEANAIEGKGNAIFRVYVSRKKDGLK